MKVTVPVMFFKLVKVFKESRGVPEKVTSPTTVVRAATVEFENPTLTTKFPVKVLQLVKSVPGKLAFPLH